MADITISIPEQYLEPLAIRWNKPPILYDKDGLAVYKDGEEQVNPQTDAEFVTEHLTDLVKREVLAIEKISAIQAAEQAKAQEIENTFNAN